MFSVNKLVEERESKYNGKIKVLKTVGLGTYIQVEGLTQSGGVVEDIWKSSLRKAKSKKPEVQNVLVLGLGGGSVAKYIKKFWPEAVISGVDIDSVIVALGKRYLGLKDVDIKIEDAASFLKETKQKFDLIVVDLYKGCEYPKKFETRSFLTLLKLHLKESGVVIFNRLYSEGKRTKAIYFGETLEKFFSRVTWHYPLANLVFICFK